MSEDCIFCRIVSGDLPAQVIHREEGLLAIMDIHPVAETHALVIPERHISDLRDLMPEDAGLWLRLTQAAHQVALDLGHAQGYRFYVSVGPGGGQSVPHLHIHVMAGAMRRLPV
ncbi:MAG: HIT domain-containing protein [Candidatus Dormibacteraeota bacterium]|nr:HIT domain-containing protein [Candidatus Dormibacteraeota bacterium]